MDGVGLGFPAAEICTVPTLVVNASTLTTKGLLGSGRIRSGALVNPYNQETALRTGGSSIFQLSEIDGVLSGV